MDHSSLSASGTRFKSHVGEGLYLAHHVSIGDISTVLPPLAGKSASARRIVGHWRNRVAYQRQTLSLVEESASSLARGEGLVDERRVDDADNRNTVDGESDGHAEHGE